ncbi:hypothetical protein GWI33_008068 [Rhynchophorus ferrugineus]|uniref:Uncharacterized protein n=1 Tax=Rhynchophorus ferrugineus TaxID=354439 RepID=A0A834ID69_RHYFE|nr:hypothetical protein GWI33_008068 [Rhynchophorus ferrugineus]
MLDHVWHIRGRMTDLNAKVETVDLGHVPLRRRRVPVQTFAPLLTVSKRQNTLKPKKKTRNIEKKPGRFYPNRAGGDEYFIS